jgi:hypothetical protein
MPRDEEFISVHMAEDGDVRFLNDGAQPDFIEPQFPPPQRIFDPIEENGGEITHRRFRRVDFHFPLSPTLVAMCGGDKTKAMGVMAQAALELWNRKRKRTL